MWYVSKTQPYSGQIHKLCKICKDPVLALANGTGCACSFNSTQ